VDRRNAGPETVERIDRADCTAMAHVGGGSGLEDHEGLLEDDEGPLEDDEGPLEDDEGLVDETVAEWGDLCGRKRRWRARGHQVIRHGAGFG
jgi:hypothetical protein